MSNQIEIIAVRKKGKNYIVSLSDNRDMLICSLLAERFSLKPGIELSVAAFNLLKEQSDIIRGREYLHYLLYLHCLLFQEGLKLYLQTFQKKLEM